jgi:hypothetical protein
VKKLIAVCGEAQHGKDTVSLMIAEMFYYKKIAFADPLKKMMYALNPYVVLPDGTLIRLAKLVDEIGWDGAKKHPEVRRLLQYFGTEVMREYYGPNVWIDLARKEVNKYDKAIISDLRFPGQAGEDGAEEGYVRSEGGLIIKIVRPKYDNGVDKTHASESLLSQIKEDHLVVNDGSVRELSEKIIPIVEAYENNKGAV